MSGGPRIESRRLGWVIALIALNMLLSLVLLVQEVPLIWGLVLFAWLNILLVAVRRVTAHAFLVGFLVSFFVFLLVRVTMDLVFDFRPFVVQPEVLSGVSKILLAGLFGLTVGYLLARVRPNGTENGPSPMRQYAGGETRLGAEHLRIGALAVFYIALPLAAFSLARDISFVSGASYAALYTEEFVQRTAGIGAAILQYAHEVAFVAFVAYLATLPRFRAARVPVLLWIVYVGSFMLTGRRRDVAVFLLFVICYAIARNRITPDDPWVRPGRAWLAVLAIPVLLAVFGLLEAWRGVGSAGTGEHGVIPEFIYGQGVSVTVLQNVVAYADQLPDQPYLLEFARTGVIPRLIGLPILEGNSVVRALEGGSLSHSLSWLVLGPTRYLSGVSTGTSFLAEGFVEFGLWGAACVGAAYGLLLAWLDHSRDGDLSANVLRLLVAQSVLWAPRGTSTGFIQILLAPSTWLGLIAAVLIAALAARHGRRGVSLSTLDQQMPGPEETVRLGGAEGLPRPMTSGAAAKLPHIHGPNGRHES